MCLSFFMFHSMQVLFELSLLRSRAQWEEEGGEGERERDSEGGVRESKGGGSEQEKEADKEKARYYCWCAPFFNFNYSRDCIDVSDHVSSIIYQGERDTESERERKRVLTKHFWESHPLWTHTLSEVNAVNAVLWRDPLTNHGNHFPVSPSMCAGKVVHLHKIQPQNPDAKAWGRPRTKR